MKLNFELTTEDFVKWQEYYMKNHGPFFARHMKWIFLVLMAAIFFGQILPDFQNNSLEFIDWRRIMPMGIFLVLGIYFFFRFRKGGLYKGAMEKLIKNNPQLIGEREMEFFDETFRITLPDEVAEIRYEGVYKWESNDEYDYIFKSKNLAFIIPRRIFANEMEYQEFVDFLGSRLEPQAA